MRNRVIVVGSLLLAAISLIAQASAAPLTIEAVQAVLDAGWKPTTKGYNEALAEYQTLAQSAGTDDRLHYAMTLVAIQNHRYADAAKFARTAVDADGSSQHARMALAYTALVTRDNTTGIEQMTMLAKQLANLHSTTKPAGPDAESMSANLGRLAGFLTGPANLPSGSDKIKDVEDELSRSGDRKLVETFRQAHAGVLTNYKKSRAEVGATKDQAKQDQEKQKAADQKKIDADQTDIAKQLEGLKDKFETSEKYFKSETNGLKKDLEPLKREYDRLEDRAKPLQRRINDAQQDARRLDNDAAREKDKDKKQRLQREADRIRDGIRDEQRELDRLTGEAGQVNRRANAIQSALRAAEVKHQAEVRRLQTDQTRLNQLDKRLGAKERDVAKPATGEVAAVQSLSAKLNALSNYAPFPTEAERARLLKSFDAK